MESAVQDILTWAEKHRNESITIRKEDDGDVDEVEMKLSHSKLGSLDPGDVDSYLTSHAIYLFGDGTIVNGNSRAELPGGAFIIPCRAHLRAESFGNGLCVSTEAATYELLAHPQHP